MKYYIKLGDNIRFLRESHNMTQKKLGELIPQQDNYSHMEGNSDAHIKASLFGSSVRVIIKDGQLLLGTWQAIFFCEFDGPRTRKFYVQT